MIGVSNNHRMKLTFKDLKELQRKFRTDTRNFSPFNYSYKIRQGSFLESGTIFVDDFTKIIFVPMDGTVFKMLFKQWPTESTINTAMYYAEQLVEFKLSRIYSKHGI
tara:strand:+ start:98 stop:418 length:321 start_codon:yes stop_codon:yes gene_type:complete